MAKRPVKKATAKKIVAAKSATKKRDIPSLRPEWPSCSWCTSPGVYKFTRQDQIKHCCAKHVDKMELNRGTSPSAKKKIVLAPAKREGLKKTVKRAKKALK